MKDPGLQPERTALAWSRTAMALFVDSGIVLRSGWSHHRYGIVAIGVLSMIACVLVIMSSDRRGRVILQADRRPAPMSVAKPLGIACITFLVSASAMFLYLFRP